MTRDYAELEGMYDSTREMLQAFVNEEGNLYSVSKIGRGSFDTLAYSSDKEEAIGRAYYEVSTMADSDKRHNDVVVHEIKFESIEFDDEGNIAMMNGEEIWGV